jgi:hypothetical protein
MGVSESSVGFPRDWVFPTDGVRFTRFLGVSDRSIIVTTHIALVSRRRHCLLGFVGPQNTHKPHNRHPAESPFPYQTKVLT